ncbi:MAG: PglZ domain-containing protein [Peptococcaceae bacterium]|nr:PglZ domain-containing protein [Peptococcaceae bacterium]
MGPVSRYVFETVSRELDRHGIVVWYDEGCHFKEIADRLADDKTLVVKFTGSYYRLRAAAEELFSRFDSASVNNLRRLLLYIPRAPLDRRMDVLLEISRAGSVYSDTLFTAARLALKESIPGTVLDEILSNENLSLEDIDRIAESEMNTGAGTLAVIFGTGASHEIAANYLTGPKWQEKVDEKGLLPELIKYFSKTFGLAVTGTETHTALKENLERHLLLTEFIVDSNLDFTKTHLASFSFPKQKGQEEACRRAACFMREWSGSKDIYIEMAKKVENDARLREIEIPYGAMGRLDTFPFEEEKILLSIEDLVKQGREDDALRLIEERRSSFWITVDPLRAVQWQAAEITVKLHREIKRICGEIKACKKDKPETWVRRYSSGDKGEGRWYHADMLQRRLERLIVSMDEEFALGELLKTVRRVYHDMVQQMSELFSIVLCNNGINFGGSALMQSDIYNQKVKPLVMQGPTAYFMIDSLRFEMGAELAGMLPNARILQIEPAVAVVPTITKTGMAALLPGAEEGINIVPAKEGIAAEIRGSIMDGSRDRQKYVYGIMADRATDITLGSVLIKSKKALANAILNRDLIIVRSQEIDNFGEEDNIYQARRVMTEVLADIRRAVQRLAEAGVRNFVITADHGHLFGEELNDGMKLDPPGGDTLELHRRCWIGRGGSGSPAFLRFTAAELGHGGDLEFAFPIGTGGFKVKGGRQAYFHGGISLQELIIPVITFKMDTVKPAKASDQFRLNTGKKEITNRLFTVSALYVPAMFSPSEYNVRLTAVEGGKEIAMAATAVYGFDEGTGLVTLRANEENHVTMMVSGGEPKGEMAIQMLDAGTGLILTEIRVPYHFAL